METSPEIDPRSGAPRDYACLFRHYQGLIAKVARSSRVPEQEIDDVVMEIVLAFMAKGSLEKYSYDILHDNHRPRQVGDIHVLDKTAPRYRPAKFATYLRQFAFLYSLQNRDRYIRKAKREPVVAQEERSDGTTLLDELKEPAFHDRILVEQAAQRVFDKVAAQTEPSSGRSWAVAEVLEVCGQVYDETGRIDRRMTADLLGISVHSVQHALKARRKALTDEGAAEVIT